MKRKNLPRLLFPCAVLFFGVLCLCTYRMLGDDLILYFAREREDCFSCWMPNGRYLANWLVYFLLRYSFLRPLIFLSLFFGLIWLLGNLIPQRSSVLPWLAFLFVLIMPAQFFLQSMLWYSAFPIYVLPMVTVFGFLLVFFLEAEGHAVKSRLMIPLFAVSGLAGALCAEHMTIYSIVLAVFAVVYSAARKDLRVRGYQLAYLVGAAAGAVLMFTNPNYDTIAESGDTVGERAMEFSLSDISRALYTDVIPLFAKRFFVIHILIAGCLLYLYLKNDGNPEKNKDRRRYTLLSLAAVCGYAVYACFTTGFTDLAELSPDMRVRAVECVFAFLDIVGIIYLSYVLLNRYALMRVVLLICSAFFCSAIFCVVSPVNARCFFADYCFWAACTLEFVQQSLLTVSGRTRRTAAKLSAGCCAAAACLVANVLIVNKVGEQISIAHLREQNEKGIRNYELITTPYPAYGSNDPIWEDVENELLYARCFFDYYDLDIDADHDTFSMRQIGLYDWFM